MAGQKGGYAMIMHEGIYPHECEWPTCQNVVQFDDERYCFKHSPDSGSFEYGYSAKERTESPYDEF